MDQLSTHTKLPFSASLGSHGLRCTGGSSGFRGGAPKELRGDEAVGRIRSKICAHCESSRAPHTPISSMFALCKSRGEVLVGWGSGLEGSGEASFSGAHVACFYWAGLSADHTRAPSSLPGARPGGGGRKAEIMTASGCVPAKSTHVT